MSASPAIIVTCDASTCNRITVATSEHAATYKTARAWACSWGSTSPFEGDWRPDRATQHGGHGYPEPFEHLSDDTGTGTTA